MKIRNKIILLFAGWLLFLLLIVNLLVYALFFQLATKNERERLSRNGNQILAGTSPAALLTPGKEDLLAGYLSGNAMLRIVNPQGVVQSQAVSGDFVLELPPRFVTQAESEVLKRNRQYFLIMRVPILQGSDVAGTLELGEALETLQQNINILVSVLISSDIGAVLIGIIGATLVSNTILHPISRLIRTMEEIENSLEFKRIPVADRPHDEIYKMTAAFNRMIERIEESFGKQRQFVSDASHELKTPLTIIESHASILRRWGLTDKEVEKEAVEAIYEESIRMKRLAQQLLDLDRHGQGDRLETAAVDLTALSKQAARVIEKVHNREIRVFSSAPQIVVQADKMKIRQLLLILLDNARKYSGLGIELYLQELPDRVELRVRDYGIGIPRKELGRIFERFYRVDKARQRVTGGTGLGLSIAKSIVDRHGGTIRVESEEGKGTEVIVGFAKDSAGIPDAL